jgi:hypothetical protein
LADKWNPKNIDIEEVKDLNRRVRSLLLIIEQGAHFGDYTLQDTYGDMFEYVEKLYTALDLGALAEDNARRYAKHKKKVRKAHGTGS